MSRIGTVFSPARHRSLGVSLIEALVALAVMGFGMLGVMAMQSSMRQNSDIAKQRTEATRLAQAAIESRRTFTAMATTAGQAAWADLASQAPEDIAGTNATYTRTVTILDLGSGRSKNMIVDVQWVDRSGAPQSVRLASSITGSVPELAATIGIPAWGGTLVRRPSGRHPAIPAAAVDQRDGTSNFSPPGAAGLYWVFNNATANIDKICSMPGVCSTVYMRLLAGYVLFSTGATQPSAVMAEAPTGASVPLDVFVNYTTARTVVPPAPPLPPFGTTTPPCYKDVQATYIAYFCAVTVDPISGSMWTGQAYLDISPLPLASSAADASATRYRVCRYTPVRGCQPVVPSVSDPASGDGTWIYAATSPGSPTPSCTDPDPMAIPATPKRKLSNAEHPLNYVNVTESLVNQNFLLIRAGNGADPFHCPDDVIPSAPALNLINTSTWHHQPAS